MNDVVLSSAKDHVAHSSAWRASHFRNLMLRQAQHDKVLV